MGSITSQGVIMVIRGKGSRGAPSGTSITGEGPRGDQKSGEEEKREGSDDHWETRGRGRKGVKGGSQLASADHRVGIRSESDAVDRVNPQSRYDSGLMTTKRRGESGGPMGGDGHVELRGPCS